MFSFPDEGTLPGLSRVQIRFSEALYFFEQFKRHCGSPQTPRDSSFHWITYSDAFLISLLSIQDFLSPKKREQFLVGYESMKKQGTSPPTSYTPNPLLVLKLMRNRTVHHTVFAAPGQGRGKANVSRIINARVGGQNPGAWVEPRILLEQMEALITRVRGKFRRDKKKKKPTSNPKADLKETSLYIKRLQEQGQTDIRLETLFREGYERVAEICGIAVPYA